MNKVYVDYDCMIGTNSKGEKAIVNVSWDDEADRIIKFFENFGIEVEVSEG